MSWWMWVLVIVVGVWLLGMQGGILGILARLNSMDPARPFTTSRALPPPSPRALIIAKGDENAP